MSMVQVNWKNSKIKINKIRILRQQTLELKLTQRKKRLRIIYRYLNKDKKNNPYNNYNNKNRSIKTIIANFQQLTRGEGLNQENSETYNMEKLYKIGKILFKD